MKFDFIFISLTSWDWHFQREQHLACNFAKRGHKVLYIDSPISISSLIQDLYRRKTFNRLKRIFNPIEVKKNLFVYSPIVFISARTKHTLQKISNYFLLSKIKKFIKRLNFNNIIYRTSTPIGEYFVGKLNEKLTCFDILDRYPKHQLLEEKLLKKADIVFCTSKILLEEKKKFNKNIYLNENACEFRHFNKKSTFNPLGKIINNNNPIIGFVGSLYEWVDIDILEYIASIKSNLNLVLIGPYKNIFCKLNTYKNVYLLGRIPYESLPDYINKFDVCVIPFKVTNETDYINPVKMYEYLATGKPIVSTNLPEVRQYSDVIYIAEDKEDFVKKIELALKENNEELCRRRIQIAKENSWDKRVDDILEIINKFFYNKINS